jgi:SpoVK/Ycf46/Vps4 family AAA+-type ATPase
MLVFATNEPALFDAAVVDRVDEAVEFALPNQKERAALLEQYFTSSSVKHPPFLTFWRILPTNMAAVHRTTTCPPAVFKGGLKWAL